MEMLIMHPKYNPSMIVGYAFVVGDLFHIGHVRFLEKCKTYCDYLIVGVYTDELTMTYKRKPVFSLEERLEIVQSCRFVDEVRVVHNKDCTPMLKKIKNQGYTLKFLFHGDDWSREEVKGTDYIESIGGQLVQDFERLTSTTEIIDRIKAEY